MKASRLCCFSLKFKLVFGSFTKKNEPRSKDNNKNPAKMEAAPKKRKQEDDARCDKEEARRSVLLHQVIEFLDRAVSPDLVNIIAQFFATEYVIDARDVWEVTNIQDMIAPPHFHHLGVHINAESKEHELEFSFGVSFATCVTHVGIWVSLQNWTVEAHLSVAVQYYNEQAKAQRSIRDKTEWNNGSVAEYRVDHRTPSSLLVERIEGTSTFIIKDSNEFGVLVAILPRFVPFVSHDPCPISAETFSGYENQAAQIAQTLASLYFHKTGLCIANDVPPRVSQIFNKK